MNMFRKLVSVICVLCLLMSMSITVFAADHSAGTYEEMETAFFDTDPVVNIDVTNDIDFDNHLLYANEGQSYNIGSENGSILNNAGFIGEGSVTITTDINSDNTDPALLLFDSHNVTVEGNITSSGEGVYADNSTVIINGNITAAFDGISAYDSTITMEGNITAYGDGINITSSNLTFDGNIDAYSDGIESHSSKVSVEGTITAGADGIDAEDGSTVTMAGNITAADACIESDNSEVYVDGNLIGADGNPEEVDFSDPTGFSDGGSGIDAIQSKITVTGDVTGGTSYGTWGYGGDGIYAEKSTVSVGGNVTGGNVIADPSTAANEGEESWGGIAIHTDNVSTIHVAGNATGGNTNGNEGYAGNSIEVILSPTTEEESGSITIAGTVTGGSTTSATDKNGVGMVIYQEFAEDSNVAEENIPTISLGGCDTIEVYVESEEFEAAVADKITVGRAPATVTYIEENNNIDPIWNTLHAQLRSAKKGDTVTINLGHRTYISGYLLNLARQMEVTLIIQWDGGSDITFNPTFDGIIDNRIIKLVELAEMVK